MSPRPKNPRVPLPRVRGAMSAHVELIRPRERLAKGFLDGTGYVPPETPVTAAELAEHLQHVVDSGVPFTVWKVSRRSVRRNVKRLSVHGCRIAGAVVGSTGEWLFFAPDVAPALRALLKANGLQRQRFQTY